LGVSLQANYNYDNETQLHGTILWFYLFFFMGFTPNLEAQVTQPTPQDLPFTQNFSTLDATSTTYLTGFQVENGICFDKQFRYWNVGRDTPLMSG
jgi:hypothetical protein